MALTSLSMQSEQLAHWVIEDVPIYEQMGTNHRAHFHHFPASKLEEHQLHKDSPALDFSPKPGVKCNHC